MRLLIIGKMSSDLVEASKIAMNKGAKVGHADSIESALIALRAGKGADLIMMDVNMPIDKMIQALKAERFNVPLVGCGVGENNQEKAAQAIRHGANEYIPLPPDAELIAAVLEAVCDDNQALMYKDPAMEDVIRMAQQVSTSDASVLITGESGTGKEVISRLVHKSSNRSKENFISVNCAAIPENLLESELFGHEKGAFTGAVAKRIGKFEEANNGTLLLDEISEMHLHLQAKLLRAIQERVIDPVGASRPVKVNIRILATSNRDLWQYVKEGKFREDLYFRLNVINIEMPPLRNRPLDVAFLAAHFIEKYAKVNGVPVRPLSEEALKQMQMHSWPGNVRELENTMHRAVLMATGLEITPSVIFPKGIKSLHPQNASDSPIRVQSSTLVGQTVAEVEKTLIMGTLDHCLGNRTHAANILGISLRTLRNKLNLYKTEHNIHIGD
ncbi:sigma-54-dependent transcriptional regulator [Candidatus Bodocaedibacter vickermanii]|uniref:Transcriptional regulatory protein ZraR n=1 Tax=Candidatus Bodocaedibacter vickermanii TaxID=2741701 RepID=A0A7L9RTV8_9PROT|nr:Transcriptional regulatory protein ZraR [Candidatus Paracaedibacteraceae bacterium 'Lake Konstanz']